MLIATYVIFTRTLPALVWVKWFKELDNTKKLESEGNCKHWNLLRMNLMYEFNGPWKNIHDDLLGISKEPLTIFLALKVSVSWSIIVCHGLYNLIRTASFFGHSLHNFGVALPWLFCSVHFLTKLPFLFRLCSTLVSVDTYFVVLLCFSVGSSSTSLIERNEETTISTQHHTSAGSNWHRCLSGVFRRLQHLSTF